MANGVRSQEKKSYTLNVWNAMIRSAKILNKKNKQTNRKEQ